MTNLYTVYYKRGRKWGGLYFRSRFLARLTRLALCWVGYAACLGEWEDDEYGGGFYLTWHYSKREKKFVGF